MILQVTAYDVVGGVAVLVTTAEVEEGKRNWTVLVQELHDPGVPLEDGWDLAWYVAGLISDRAAERAPQVGRSSVVAGGTAALPGDGRLSH